MAARVWEAGSLAPERSLSATRTWGLGETPSLHVLVGDDAGGELEEGGVGDGLPGGRSPEALATEALGCRSAEGVEGFREGP
jgi:hypothetical protein